jgi:hypothetical protein
MIRPVLPPWAYAATAETTNNATHVALTQPAFFRKFIDIPPELVIYCYPRSLRGSYHRREVDVKRWLGSQPRIKLPAMSRPEEYFLVFANSDYTLDLSRFIRTEDADGWHFFQGKENIGTMLIIKTGEMHYVHASFTRELEPQKITNYIRSLLWSLGVHNALVTIHSGKQVAHFDYEI